MELVFPPLWTPTEAVSLSTPSLKAFLDEKGFKVHQADLNIQTWNSIFSEKYLLHVSNRIDEEMETLSRSSLDSEGIRKYTALSTSRTLLDTFTPRLIENAKEILRKKRKDVSPFEIRNAGRILHNADYVISSLYYPTRFRAEAYLMRCYHNHSLPDLLEAVESERENLFIDVYTFYDMPRAILEKADRVVGFSVGSFNQLVPSLTLAASIKKLDPGVFIVFGGPSMPYMGRSLELPSLFHFVDAFVLGEGETPLFVLLDSLENHRSFERVPNIIFRDSSGTVKKSDIHSREDVNSLPTPSFDDLDLDAYFNASRILPLITARGCYWNRCAFCSLCSTYGSKYRERDIDLVIEDITKLKDRHKVMFFLFNDESISFHRMHMLCDAILEAGLEIYWRALVRPEKTFTRDVFEKAYRAGCRLICMGLESGSQHVLDLMEKGIEVKSALQAIRHAHDAGLWTNVFTIFGFPGETAADARATTETVVAHQDIIDSNPTSLCRVEYGSRLYFQREKFGIALPDTYDYELQYLLERGEYTVDGRSAEDVLSVKAFHDKCTIAYPLHIDFHEGTSVGNLLIWIKNHGRDEFKEIFVKVNMQERKKNEENMQKIEKKMEKAIIFPLPHVVYNQITMHDHRGKEAIYCVLFNTETYGFVRVKGIFKRFLDLCDSHRTLETVFTQLAEEYSTPSDTLATMFLPVVKQLLSDGSFLAIR